MNLDTIRRIAGEDQDRLRRWRRNANMGVWAEEMLGYTNAPFQWEWYGLLDRRQRLCLVAPRDSSKALGLDTTIVTPSGRTTMKDVQPGDTVVGGDGQPTTVTAKSDVFYDHDCYRVVFDDGQEFIADAGHLWITHYAWRGTRVVTTEQVARDHGVRQDHRHVVTDRHMYVYPTVSIPVQCIQTESGSYMIGDGIVTHNSQVCTVNASAFRAITQPGCWTYVFAASSELAQELKARIDDAVQIADPQQIDRAETRAKRETIFANGSRISAAGAGVAVRGQHPDFIIGDDVLEEATTLTEYQRDKTSRWWHGTVAGMAHPRTSRIVAGVKRGFAATQIVLVGTPFAQQDLLMATRDNPLYTFRRYASECAPHELADGWAVDYTGEPAEMVAA